MKIHQIIKEYNKYRSPEVVAKLIKKPLTIKFSGSFCKTCAPYEYFEDFKIMLENELGKSFYIKKIYDKKENYEVVFDNVKRC